MILKARVSAIRGARVHFKGSPYALEFDFNLVHCPNEDDYEYIQSLDKL